MRSEQRVEQRVEQLVEQRSPFFSLENNSKRKYTEDSPQKAMMKTRKVHTATLPEAVVVKENRQKSGRSSKPESRRTSSSRNGSRQSSGGDDDQDMRLRQVKSKMRQLLHEKQATDDRNKELERENRELRSMLQQAGGSKRSWTNKDEEEFQENRKLRLEDQTLVKAPLFSHLKKVDYVYEIKNQWALSNKPQFNLQFPARFQRAPDLDIRDKRNEEREAAIMEKQAASSDANQKERKSLLGKSGLFPRQS